MGVGDAVDIVGGKVNGASCYLWSSWRVVITNVDCFISFPYIRRGNSGGCRCSDVVLRTLNGDGRVSRART